MARRDESRHMTSQPTLIPHLIEATNALGRALSELNADASETTRQDGIEHLSEAELLLELLRRRLDQQPTEYPPTSRSESS